MKKAYLWMMAILILLVAESSIAQSIKPAAEINAMYYNLSQSKLLLKCWTEMKP